MKKEIELKFKVEAKLENGVVRPIEYTLRIDQQTIEQLGWLLEFAPHLVFKKEVERQS